MPDDRWSLARLAGLPARDGAGIQTTQRHVVNAVLMGLVWLAASALLGRGAVVAVGGAVLVLLARLLAGLGHRRGQLLARRDRPS